MQKLKDLGVLKYWLKNFDHQLPMNSSELKRDPKTYYASVLKDMRVEITRSTRLINLARIIKAIRGCINNIK